MLSFRQNINIGQTGGRTDGQRDCRKKKPHIALQQWISILERDKKKNLNHESLRQNMLSLTASKQSAGSFLRALDWFLWLQAWCWVLPRPSQRITFLCRQMVQPGFEPRSIRCTNNCCNHSATEADRTVKIRKHINLLCRWKQKKNKGKCGAFRLST